MTAIKSALEDFRTVIGLVRSLVPEWDPAAMLAGIDAAEAEVEDLRPAPVAVAVGPEPGDDDVLDLLAGLGEPVTEVPEPQCVSKSPQLPVWGL